MSRPEPLAIVFDKDGVLVDSEQMNVDSAFAAFAELGHRLEERDRDAIVGRHPVDYLPSFCARFAMTAEQTARLRRRQDALYASAWEAGARLMPHAREALAAAREATGRVALATSSDRREVESFLDRFELRDAFDFTLSLDDVERAKPDPEVYRRAASRFRVEPARMWVVEDSAHGVAAAVAAGTWCIAVASDHVTTTAVRGAAERVSGLCEVAARLRAARG